MVVDPSPIQGGTSPSESDIPIFEQLVNEAMAAAATAMAQADRAEEAAESVDSIPVPDVIQIWVETEPD